MIGDAAANNLLGNAGDDSISGAAGVDYLVGNAGNDTIDGGADSDYATYFLASGSVTVNLTLGTTSGADGNDVLTSIENAGGSNGFGDTLIGSSGANSLSGEGGDDSLNGNGGNDTATGGTGRDQFILSALAGALLTVTDFQAGANADAIDVSLLLADSAIRGGYDISMDPFASGYLRAQQSGADTLIQWDPDASAALGWQTVAVLQNVNATALVRQNYSGIAIVGTDQDDTLVGDIFTDVIVAGLGNDTLDGGVGADRMEGGKGADTYYVDNVTDLVIELDNALGMVPDPRPGLDLGGAIDKVIASVSFSLAAYVENLTLAAAAGNLSGLGNALDNVLIGNEGHNSFTGAGGNDNIDGGAGADTAVYSASRSNYTWAKTSTGFTVVDSTGAEGTDTLSGIERLHFSDTKLAYDLDGHAGQTAKLLGAVFGVAYVTNKQYVGIGLQLLDGGMSYEQLASLAVEVTGKTSHAEVVSLLWNNLFGAAPTTAQVAPGVALLDGGMTVGTLTVLAADSSLNTENIGLVGLGQSGIEFVA
ncbi:MAG: hypothetical protein IPF55_21355 [Rhodoferax sp.]|nr:hypothetical protein [Rhodoferax sp.]